MDGSRPFQNFGRQPNRRVRQTRRRAPSPSAVPLILQTCLFSETELHVRDDKLSADLPVLTASVILWSGGCFREPQPWSDVVTDTVKTLVVPSIEDNLDTSSFIVLGPQVTSRAGRRAAPGPRQRPWNGSLGGVPQRPFIRLSGRSNQPTAWSFQLCTSSVLCPLNKSLSGRQLHARHCIRRLGGAQMNNL